MDFCCENELQIENTWFKKKSNKRWTWIAPNANTRNQIDYIIAKWGNRNIKNCEVARSFNCDTDHRLVQCTMKIRKDRRKMETQKSEKTKMDTKHTLIRISRW